ncbi:MAG: hypoxanthine phosphoribosyltransferase [Kordiimonas sp.]|nr:hypoxanthine phosphoribosyltransferase [Kordiimonas sp.]
MTAATPQIELLFSAAEIGNRLQQMASELAPTINNNTVIITILNSSFMFAADLMRALYNEGCHFETDFLCLSGYGDDQQVGTIKLIQDIKIPLHGRSVLLLDDILDSGNTLAYALQHLRPQNPSHIQAAFLLDKGRGIRPAVPTTTGFSCPDQFVVGYGMDSAQKYRELPYIGTVNQM